MSAQIKKEKYLKKRKNPRNHLSPLSACLLYPEGLPPAPPPPPQGPRACILLPKGLMPASRRQPELGKMKTTASWDGRASGSTSSSRLAFLPHLLLREHASRKIRRRPELGKTTPQAHKIRRRLSSGGFEEASSRGTRWRQGEVSLVMVRGLAGDGEGGRRSCGRRWDV
jgi:hypothetical protein